MADTDLSKDELIQIGKNLNSKYFPETNPGTTISSHLSSDNDLVETGRNLNNKFFPEEAAPVSKPKKKEERGVIAETASALGAGLAQTAEGLTSTAEMIGVPGAASGTKFFQDLQNTDALARPDYLKEGDVLQNPERLADWRWWVRSLGENLPNMATMMIPGVAAIKGAQALNWGTKAIRAAGLAGAWTGSMTLEAGGAYSQAKQEMTASGQYDADTIESVATTEGLVAGTVNSIIELLPFNNLFLRQSGADRLLKRIVRQGLFEGSTETLQEAVNVYVEKLGHKPDQELSDNIGRLLESGLIGGALGGMAGGVISGKEAKTKPGTLSKAKKTVMRSMGMNPDKIGASATPTDEQTPMTTSANENKTIVTEDQRQERINEETAKENKIKGKNLFDAVANEDLAEQQGLEAARIAETARINEETAKLAAEEDQKTQAAVADAQEQQSALKTSLAGEDKRKQTIVDDVLGLTEKRLLTAAQKENGVTIVPAGPGLYTIETPNGPQPVNLFQIRQNLAAKRITDLDAKDEQEKADAITRQEIEQRKAIKREQETAEFALDMARRALKPTPQQLEILAANRDKLKPHEIANLDRALQEPEVRSQNTEENKIPLSPPLYPEGHTEKGEVITEKENPDYKPAPLTPEASSGENHLVGSMLLDLDNSSKAGLVHNEEEKTTTRLGAGIAWLTAANKGGVDVDRAAARTVLTKVQDNETLTPRQQKIFDAIIAAAKKHGSTLTEQISWAEKGFVPVSGKKLEVDNLVEGDQFVVSGEEFKVTDIDDKGNVTMKDGTIRTVKEGTVIKDVDYIKQNETATEFNPEEFAAQTPEAKPETKVIELPIEQQIAQLQQGIDDPKQYRWHKQYQKAIDKLKKQIPLNPPLKKGEKKTNILAAKDEPIQDFGEKIGGARKDTAERGYTMTKTAKPESSEPAWRKRFIAAQKVHDPGRWGIIDTKAGRFGSRNDQTFSSQEEAEKAIPLFAVAQSHRVYESRNSSNEWEIYKKVGDRKLFKVVNKTFSSREEGMKYMVQHAEEILNIKTSFGEEILPIPEIAKREGTERRTTDATPEMFNETFAPRGIEFGNWNNQEERQQVLNHAYDGLLDLADVLHISPKALMLNGDLAIAFGARGQGLVGAKAHYETDYGVINLTKMKGAGSLAHEWFHALDHYMGRLDTKAKSEKITNARGDLVYPAKSPSANNLSHGASYKSELRPEIKEAYKNLMETMYKKAEQYVEDTKKADEFVGKAREELKKELDKIRNYLGRDLVKEYAGYRKNTKGLSPVSTEQLVQFDQLANILLEGGDLETNFRYNNPAGENATTRPKGMNRSAFGRLTSSRRSNDTLDGISAIYKAVRNRTGFNSEGSGTLDGLRNLMTLYNQRIKMFEDAKSGTEKTKKIPTSYAIEAKKMDQARTGDYWSEPHEMAARAFAAYVEDKIAEKGGQSDFLVYHAHGGILLPMIDGYIARPYPEGNERIAINKAFDDFIGILEEKETEKGTMLFSIEDEPAFYSQLSRVVASKLPNSGTPEQFRTMINAWASKGEFKADELKWSGVNEWLDGQTGKISKQDVVDYLAANQVEIKEITKGEREKSKDELAFEFFGTDGYSESDAMQQQYIDEYVDQNLEGDGLADTKFSSYQLPGGENYKELLLTLPVIDPIVEHKDLQWKENRQGLWAWFVNDKQVSGAFVQNTEQQKEIAKSTIAKKTVENIKGNYRSAHWDESNVLAHVRMNDRTDADGNKVLLLEEVQSDWHQEGRKKGYQNNDPEIQNHIEELNRKIAKQRPNAPQSIIDERDNLLRQQGTVPAAPFSKTWPELVMKRMLRYAAENSYDKLAWTTGEQQAERYDLSKVLNEIRYKKSGDNYFIHAFDKNDQSVIDDTYPPEKLEDIIGKELAQKIINGEGNIANLGNKGQLKILSGLDLKVGGEGMKGFYDSIIPSFLNKYAKKWGAKVRTSDLTTIPEDLNGTPGAGPEGTWLPKGKAETISVHSIDITPSMKESVMAGQPMFAQEKPGARLRLGDVELKDMVRDLSAIVKGTQVIEKDDGTLWIKTKSGDEVRIESADEINPNTVSLTINKHYAKENMTGKRIAGMYQPGEIKKITLVQDVAGIWTASHEFEHFLEDIGAIAKADQVLLDKKITYLIAKDPETYGYLAGRSLAEKRAEWVGRTITGMYDANTPVGKIIQKIRDIIDSIINALGLRTAGGIIRDIETGGIYRDVKGEELKVKGEGQIPLNPPLEKGEVPQLSLAEDVTEKAVASAGKKVSRAVELMTGKVSPEKREFWRKFKIHWQEFWRPLSTLPNADQLMSARLKGMGNAGKAMNFVEAMHTELDAYPDEVKKSLFQYLDGQIPLETLPEEIEIDIPKETGRIGAAKRSIQGIIQNRDVKAPPSGETKTVYPRKVAKGIQQRNSIIGEMAVDRGFFTQETFEKHDGHYVHYMYAKHILGDDAPVGITSSGKLNLSWTIGRNPNLTDQQRKELGRIEDASVAVPVGMGKALTDIAKFDYLKTIADNSDWVWQPSVVRIPIGKKLATPIHGRTRRYVMMGVGKLVEEVKTYGEMMRVQPSPEVEEIHKALTAALDKAQKETEHAPEGFEQVPNSRAYGPLAGMFVAKPILDDLRPVMDVATDRGKLLNTIVAIEQKGMAAFKMGKVALNIPTMVRNVGSNVIQINLSGRNLVQIFGPGGDLAGAIESMKAKDNFYEEARDMALFNTNWFATEINEVLQSLRKAESGRIDKVMMFVKDVAKFYGRIDDFFKLAMYRQQRESGKTIDQAALHAMHWGMDYSLTSRSIKGLRQTIVPFATYQYKIAPLIAESLKKRPWVLAKFALIYPAAKMLAMALHDLDDDDWDDLQKQLPAYIKKSGSMMILPWKTDKGQWQWVNLEYFFPWGNYLAMFRDARATDSGEALRDLGISNPFLSMFFTGLSAREDSPPLHAYFGTPIYNALDPAPVKVAKYLEYMINTWMPSMLTRQGAVGYTGKMLMGDEDRWGRSVDLPQAAGRWFGLNIVSVSPEQSRAQVAVKIQDMRKEMSRIEADPSRSDEEKEEYRTRLNEKLGEIAKEAPAAILPITKAKGHDNVYEALTAMASKGILHTSPPSRSVEIAGIPMKMSMEQYKDYLDKSSEVARRKLGALVVSPAWETMPDYRKGVVVEHIVANARKSIRQRIKGEIARDNREKILEERRKQRQ